MPTCSFFANGRQAVLPTAPDSNELLSLAKTALKKQAPELRENAKISV